MSKFYAQTFGCTANTSATELMIYLLRKCGHKQIKTINDADFALINTCIVKAPTESKVKDLLLKLHEKTPLIVAGCLPQVLYEWCQENLLNATLLGVDHFGNVCLAAKNLLNKKPYNSLSRDSNFCSEINRERMHKHTGIIEISKGCTGNCSYCIVKIAKGKLVSKKEEIIMLEAKNAIEEGCRELWLTAQDTASYGIDSNSNLPAIVKKISSIQTDFRIRIGMMNPDYALKILNDLKHALQLPKVYKFIHMPVQSGSNDILMKMKRKYLIEDFNYIIRELRKQNITLSTDIIVGFPGETEEDFNKTKKLVLEKKFDIINISKYGDRKGTEASHSRDKIPTELVKKRSSELTEITKKITLERNREWIGWKGSALAVKYDDEKSQTILRNDSYKVIAINDSDLPLGKRYSIKVIDAMKTRLIGTLIE
ncbi:MAG: tRNA (N(6)-L-threonylcarbamoyladenosine(37)-C(2))-methylthiotransferase [Asgard group archaeon]|nr:tRNA (N(6)-L-threonylcarbamoyladenosine(37)-C(2))-methylthiotransferase [Asgard group archaeon]